MKKLLLILIGLIIFSSYAQSQTATDTIALRKAFGGYHFYQNGERLNMNKLVKTMETNERAYTEVKEAQDSYTLATILGVAGGALIGWPLGTAAGGGDPKWIMAGVGAGLLAFTIPINKKFNKQINTAIQTYNNDIPTTSHTKIQHLRFSISGNGFGLCFKF